MSSDKRAALWNSKKSLVNYFLEFLSWSLSVLSLPIFLELRAVPEDFSSSTLYKMAAITLCCDTATNITFVKPSHAKYGLSRDNRCIQKENKNRMPFASRQLRGSENWLPWRLCGWTKVTYMIAAGPTLNGSVKYVSPDQNSIAEKLRNKLYKGKRQEKHLYRAKRCYNCSRNLKEMWPPKSGAKTC